jgi:hypothetical protein
LPRPWPALSALAGEPPAPTKARASGAMVAADIAKASFAKASFEGR